MTKRYNSVPLRLSDQAGFIENTLPSEVQVLKTGNYFHQGREIPITSADLQKMVFNFNEKVRGIDLMLDYGHNTEGEAAAWFSELYLAEDDTELWAKVTWTEGGKDAVLSKKYRYISADFDFNYKDNETLTEHGPTLFGAGLTNRPVVKRMEPIVQLSEKTQYQENEMELEKKLDELSEMLKQMMVALEKMAPKEEEKEEMKEEMKEKEEEMGEKEKLGEDEKVGTMLSENARLIEENNTLKKEQEFNKLFTEGKVVAAQKEAYMAGDMIKFAELATELHTGANGSNHEADKKVKDAEAEVVRLAEKEMEATGLTFGKSVSKVLIENPALAKQYREKFN